MEKKYAQWTHRNIAKAISKPSFKKHLEEKILPPVTQTDLTHIIFLI